MVSVEGGDFVTGDAHAEVAAVVVSYNSAADLPDLIDDLRRAARDCRVRLVVVDNQSSDGTVDLVRAHQDVELVETGGNLGYAGGINAGLRVVGDCDAVLILNSDLGLAHDTLPRLIGAADADLIGAVVPRILDEDGVTYPSLRREPTLTRIVGDALFGSRMWRSRPSFLSEIDYRPSSYTSRHDVDWATGAALLIPERVVREIGEWNEDFFLYSEETDYFRRIRESGRKVRFEPSAVVRHRQGGSGTSPQLAALMAVNRVRYVEQHHGWAYSTSVRGAVALGELLRAGDAVNRRTVGVVLNRRHWHELPKATKPTVVNKLSGSRQRGAVIIPAYDEARVIKRTLEPLSEAAVDGFIELIVVCNGCTDDTAAVARTVPGARVVELEQGSKPGALNAGDREATLWPRLYLDADIQISAAAVVAVLDTLSEGDVLVARPDSRYDSRGASRLVRSYYRARRRIRGHQLAMWGAGAYGLSEKGHERFGVFPMVTDDDLYVDTRFDVDEKAVVTTDSPSVVTTPTDTKSLLAILRRGHRGDTELVALGHRPGAERNTGVGTAVAVVRSIRGPLSAIDAAVYLGMALASRRHPRNASSRWERDESSRSSS